MDQMDTEHIYPRKDTSKEHCRILLDVLEGHGLRDIVLSPGSRNAPLLISASYRESLRRHVIDDERDAAFFALGLAMVSRRPVALVCTSGTALYNYAPAVAEAFHQHIPLIVISADRPVRWIDQYDSQTLIQPGALDKIVKKSFDIPEESDRDDDRWYVNRMANEAILLAIADTPGPVHVNVRIDSPLSQIVDRADLCNAAERVVTRITGCATLHPRMINDLTERLSGKRIMVVAGFMPPDDALNKAMLLFSSLPDVVLLAETLSNLHIPGNPYAVDTVLAGMSADEKESIRPDIVIQIGGAPVSRMLKEFIREYPPREMWTLGDTYFGVDCMKSLTANIDVDPAYFFNLFYYKLKKRKDDDSTCNGYSRKWDALKSQRLALRRNFTDEAEWSELRAFRHILGSIPRDWNLFVSNGTSVRYAQLFTDNVPHASYSNRGVSGIDGTTATAAGCAAAYKGNTLLITGDMSFSYSPGALAIADIPASFKIVVINNKGGGIFRFISPTRYIEHRDRYFCADPRIDIKGLTKAYGWNYLRADNEDQLKENFNLLLESDCNTLLEVFSDEEYSASLLRRYMRVTGNSQA